MMVNIRITSLIRKNFHVTMCQNCVSQTFSFAAGGNSDLKELQVTRQHRHLLSGMCGRFPATGSGRCQVGQTAGWNVFEIAGT
jgi:hypothetical protein